MNLTSNVVFHKHSYFTAELQSTDPLKMLPISLFADKTRVVDFYLRALNTDTRIIRTLWHVPLVSISTKFHCIQ